MISKYENMYMEIVELRVVCMCLTRGQIQGCLAPLVLRIFFLLVIFFIFVIGPTSSKTLGPSPL